MIVNCKGAPTADTAFMGLTSLPIDHDHWNASISTAIKKFVRS